MSQITDRPVLNTTPAGGDLLIIRDVSDTTDKPGGTDKQIALSTLMEAAPGSVLHNFTASAVPTVNDDVDAGYQAESLWYVSSGVDQGRAFVCVDNTVDAAVWKQITPQIEMLSVESEADLSGLLSGDEYVLPAGLVMINGTVDISDKALKVSADTVLRGLANATILSTNTSGVIRSSSPASNVVIRELNVVCTTGPCFDLAGTIDYQLNVFFCGFIGASAGTVDGWDVAAFKDCFFDVADGIEFTGTTNKSFVSTSVFYGIEDEAIQFLAAYDSEAIDIAGTFFKFDASTGITPVGIDAVAGFSVERGILRGCFFEGTLTPIAGFDEGDTEWSVSQCTGLRESTTVGAFVQPGAEETTTISAVDTPVKANLATDPSSFLERFTHADNRLTYNGDDDVTISVHAGSNMGSPSNNQEVRLWIAVNDVVLDTARARSILSGGGAIDQVTAFGIARIQTGDYIEIWVENLSSDADITMVDTSLMAARA